MTRNPPKAGRRVLALTIAVLLLLTVTALAACANDGGDADDPPAVTRPKSDTSAPEIHPLVGTWESRENYGGGNYESYTVEIREDGTGRLTYIQNWNGTVDELIYDIEWETKDDLLVISGYDNYYEVDYSHELEWEVTNRGDLALLNGWNFTDAVFNKV